MEKVVYKVKDIKGDYAILVDEKGIENMIAMALLPINITIEDTVEYEDLSYTII